MASIIRIKRSSVSGNPTTLGAGELAYSALTDNGSNGGDRLYLGIGTETNGNAVNHLVIGGTYFTDKLDHTPGTLTPTSAIIVDADKKIDELLVDNLSLNGNTISTTNVNGDLILAPNGSGKTVVGNLYIGDSSTSLAEYIQDQTGGSLVAGLGIDLSYDDEAGTTTITAELASTSNAGVASFDDGDFTLSGTGENAVTINVERIQDIVGGMVSSNTESGISVTYDDNNGKLDFNVNDPIITIAGDVDGSATMTDLGNTTITVALDTVNSNVGTFGSTTAIPVVTVDAKGRVTAVTTSAIATSFDIAADSGTADTINGGETFTISGGEGIDTTVTNNTITIAAEVATSSNLGVATFNTASFDVTSGDVTIKTGGVSLAQLATKTTTLGTSTLTLGETTTSIAGLTELTVDNININGNEISSTDTNGDISLNPNGTGTVAVNGARITGLADPVNGTDAATKNYVDETAQGVSVKPAVRAATTADLDATYYNGASDDGVGSTLTIAATATLTIDGVSSWSRYDGILVKDQLNAFENGRYHVDVVGDGSTDWVLLRCAYCDESDEIPSSYVFVQEGNTYASTGWVALVDDAAAFDVGVDSINWIQFSGAGTYLAGDGLSITGTTFNVNVAASGGIEISADALQLKSNVAGNGLTLSSGVLAVGGTADRITVGADAIDIAATYVGQTSITTLGTIATGTWNATAIGATKGGTGLTTYTTGDIIYASASNTLSKLAAGAEGKVLQINASGVPVWGDIDGGTY
jgi:hypothetical protein